MVMIGASMFTSKNLRWMVSKQMKFHLGRLVATRGITSRMQDDTFAQFVKACILKHATGEWGDLTPDDKQVNEEALTPGEPGRLLSSYNLPQGIAHDDGVGGEKIWIITEWDRSVTTVLWPGEY